LIEIKAAQAIPLPRRTLLVNMPVMFSRRMKSLVAFFAVAALLLCHAVGLVQARQLERTSVDSTVACHSIPDEQGHSGKAVHVACDSGPTAAEAVKLPAITPVILPVPAAFFEPPAQSASPAWATPVAFAGAPPPFHLLHCRLRN
jgi:hypothetical protein